MVIDSAGSSPSAQLADANTNQTPSVVLNHALHSVAGNVGPALHMYNIESGDNYLDKGTHRQYASSGAATSGSDNERTPSQNSIKPAPQKQQSRPRSMLKNQVNGVLDCGY